MHTRPTQPPTPTKTHPLTEQIGMNDYTIKYSARRDGSFTQHIVYGWCRATPKSIITCWVFIQDRQRFKSRHIVGSIAYSPRVFWFGCMPIVWGVAAADVRVEVPTHKKWCLCIICVNTVVTRECCLQNLIRRRVLREEIIFYHSSGTSYLFVASRRRSSIIIILLLCSVMVDFTMGGLRVFHYTMSWILNCIFLQKLRIIWWVIATRSIMMTLWITRLPWWHLSMIWHIGQWGTPLSIESDCQCSPNDEDFIYRVLIITHRHGSPTTL